MMCLLHIPRAFLLTHTFIALSIFLLKGTALDELHHVRPCLGTSLVSFCLGSFQGCYQFLGHGILALALGSLRDCHRQRLGRVVNVSFNQDSIGTSTLYDCSIHIIRQLFLSSNGHFVFF